MMYAFGRTYGLPYKMATFHSKKVFFNTVYSLHFVQLVFTSCFLFYFNTLVQLRKSYRELKHYIGVLCREKHHSGYKQIHETAEEVRQTPPWGSMCTFFFSFALNISLQVTFPFPAHER